MNKATIFDVAAIAKVSNATVSRALNEPDKVKPETRERVLKVAKELGYKANAFAKGLASNKSTQVALIVSDLARASVAEMVKGISQVAELYGYSLLLYPSSNDEKDNETITDLVALGVDGILYLIDEISEARYKVISELKNKYRIPLVLVNTVYSKDTDLLSVAIDYEKAGYEVTKDLIQEGRKDIALLTTLKRYPISELKEAGYRRAIKEAGLKELICYTSGNLDVNKKDLTKFVNENHVDGVIGCRDSISISCMNILMDKGYVIPKDVSIYGFQNTRYTLLSRPNLSTINVPIYDMGVRAMKVLTDEIQGEIQEQTGVILLEHSIIKRETTK